MLKPNVKSGYLKRFDIIRYGFEILHLKFEININKNNYVQQDY